MVETPSRGGFLVVDWSVDDAERLLTECRKQWRATMEEIGRGAFQINLWPIAPVGVLEPLRLW